jgi:hypothetical protein
MDTYFFIKRIIFLEKNFDFSFKKMIFIFSDGGCSYKDYKKNIVKFEEGMCSFLARGSGVGRDKSLLLF